MIFDIIVLAVLQNLALTKNRQGPSTKEIRKIGKGSQV